MSEPATGTPPPAPRGTSLRAVLRLLRRIVKPIQHAAAGAIGIDESARVETVEQMLAFNARRAPGYWIQLSLAAGIAILGLVLGSTAVVIGAMLVSPLMGPIVELGMGFAVGSSFLVIRSALRVVMSTVVVVVGTALFTMVLPFHEVTAEIASRTAPTALDLLVAVFCALTAAYTTVRRTSDTTAAAAGTAIGIALVPPLCVIGYGLGTADGHIAGGSALLFTANFSAILLLAVLAFLLLGYDEVDAVALEEKFFAERDTRIDRLAGRAETFLEGVFGSRYGMAARLMVPLLFLLAVYFPLRTALDRVTWEVSARAAVQRILSDEVPGAVQRSVNIDRDAITVRLVVIGDAAAAVELEQRLATELAAATGVLPSVNVLAVADAAALSRAAAPAEGEGSPMPVLPAVEQARSRLAAELNRVWPGDAAGPLAGWSLDVPPVGPPMVTVYHFGPAIGTAGEALVASALAPALDAAPGVRDVPLDSAAITAGFDRTGWLLSLAPRLGLSRWLDRATLCITRPAADSATAFTDTVRAAIRGARARADVVSGTVWQHRWTVGRCTAAAGTASAP